MKKKAKKIILTGGGSAGHVTPNLAMASFFKKKGWKVFYIGSRDGIEKKLIGATDIPYFAISTGKLRRYFSWKNFIDPFKILFGILQSIILCIRIRPDVIFAKGGFVSFPVVCAAWLLRIPRVIHESDLYPGLANKLCAPLANKVCVSFTETAAKLKRPKTIFTGAPVREEFLYADPKKGREICNFNKRKKILLVLGGSLGSKIINDLIYKSLPRLLKRYQVVHVCGKGNERLDLSHKGHYEQFEYINEEFPDILAAADIVVSRAGASTLFEIAALRKPNILIPLGLSASRGDQISNARYFYKRWCSLVLFEDELEPKDFLETLKHAEEEIGEVEEYFDRIDIPKNSAQLIYDVVKSVINK